ncbi:MAG: hypothetical protein MdMp024_0051 [Bacteroidales bacterium]
MKTREKYTVVIEDDDDRLQKICSFSSKAAAEAHAASLRDAYVIKEEVCYLTLAMLREQGWQLRSKKGLRLVQDEESSYTELQVFCGYGVPGWLKKHDEHPFIDAEGYATIDTFENSPATNLYVAYKI